MKIFRIKKFYFIIFILFTLSFICISKEKDVNLDNDKGENINKMLCKEDFNFIKKGILYLDVIKIVGKPDEPVGSGVVMIKYNLCDNSFVILNFGPSGKFLITAVIHYPDGKKEVLVNADD